jgi:signal transduction histidine kinase
MQRERPGRADVHLAVILAALSLVEVAVIDREPRGFVLAVLMALPLAWRRIAPLLVALVISGSLAAFVRVAGEGNDYVFIVVTIVLSMYSVGAFLPIRVSVAGLLATAAVVAIGVQASEVSSTGDYLFIVFLFGAPWVAGRIARRQYAATAAAERRAADAVADERARVARELHDVVAHSVGLIVVQAGAAEQVIDRDPAAAREALATIRTTGKAALVDLRHMLGLLRSDGDHQGSEPQPDLDALDALVERVRGAGLPVQVEVQGERRPVGPGVGLAAYRVVQEALTNALKHARGSHATVRLRYEPDLLEVTVTDDGGSPNGTAGAGQGLIGMRQRVLVHDGALDAGPIPGGGFRVHARLPLP